MFRKKIVIILTAIFFVLTNVFPMNMELTFAAKVEGPLRQNLSTQSLDQSQVMDEMDQRTNILHLNALLQIPPNELQKEQLEEIGRLFRALNISSLFPGYLLSGGMPPRELALNVGDEIYLQYLIDANMEREGFVETSLSERGEHNTVFLQGERRDDLQQFSLSAIHQITVTTEGLLGANFQYSEPDGDMAREFIWGGDGIKTKHLSVANRTSLDSFVYDLSLHVTFEVANDTRTRENTGYLLLLPDDESFTLSFYDDRNFQIQSVDIASIRGVTVREGGDTGSVIAEEEGGAQEVLTLLTALVEAKRRVQPLAEEISWPDISNERLVITSIYEGPRKITGETVTVQELPTNGNGRNLKAINRTGETRVVQDKEIRGIALLSKSELETKVAINIAGRKPKRKAPDSFQEILDLAEGSSEAVTKIRNTISDLNHPAKLQTFLEVIAAAPQPLRSFLLLTIAILIVTNDNFQYSVGKTALMALAWHRFHVKEERSEELNRMIDGLLYALTFIEEKKKVVFSIIEERINPNNPDAARGSIDILIKLVINHGSEKALQVLEKISTYGEIHQYDADRWPDREKFDRRQEYVLAMRKLGRDALRDLMGKADDLSRKRIKRMLDEMLREDRMLALGVLENPSPLHLLGQQLSLREIAEIATPDDLAFFGLDHEEPGKLSPAASLFARVDASLRHQGKDPAGFDSASAKFEAVFSYDQLRSLSIGDAEDLILPGEERGDENGIAFVPETQPETLVEEFVPSDDLGKIYLKQLEAIGMPEFLLDFIYENVGRHLSERNAGKGVEVVVGSRTPGQTGLETYLARAIGIIPNQNEDTMPPRLSFSETLEWAEESRPFYLSA